MTAPARDEEQNRIDERFKELEEERRKFTEAAVRLGREKAALEVCSSYTNVDVMLNIFVGGTTQAPGREAVMGG